VDAHAPHLPVLVVAAPVVRRSRVVPVVVLLRVELRGVGMHRHHVRRRRVHRDQVRRLRVVLPMLRGRGVVMVVVHLGRLRMRRSRVRGLVRYQPAAGGDNVQSRLIGD